MPPLYNSTNDATQRNIYFKTLSLRFFYDRQRLKSCKHKDEFLNRVENIIGRSQKMMIFLRSLDSALSTQAQESQYENRPAVFNEPFLALKIKIKKQKNQGQQNNVYAKCNKRLMLDNKSITKYFP